MATSISPHLRILSSSNPTFFSPQNPSIFHFNSSSITFPSTKKSHNLTLSKTSIRSTSPVSASASDSSTTSPTFHGLCYVVGDNIDTDQIIPAEYLTLVPSNPDEYRKLGSFALIGLPDTYPIRFVDEGSFESKYSIIIAGDNFGCGSSREHAPVALGAAGTKAVVAESYARIFFRNSVSTGEIYPIESEVRICEEFTTGDVATVELGENKLINHTTGKEYLLKPIGDAGPVVEAGGIFAFARKSGMIAAAAVDS
ncbi:3-isopropylmalate dehydratase small subunit 1-like [Silene latifolia]|uniref:3-isopropylmalate dehydratase small subunit 1-like n=1 Tax=Silene latifolia TaxID=37657 RepID=UPI003D771567